MRVGSSRTTRVNVRIIAATNVDLAAAVDRGHFRQDLYYRLKTVTIVVPPLRERTADIPLLAEHFVRLFCERNHLQAPALAEDAKQILRDQYWSGNVRELRNVVESVLTLHRGADRLTADLFRPHLQHSPAGSNLPVQVTRPSETLERELLFRTLLDLRREVGEVKTLLVAAINRAQPPTAESAGGTLHDLERERILRVLEENRGNRRKTARDLGIGERTLYRKLKEYEIS
jgi:DNA-binding NtrC family response regulator